MLLVPYARRSSPGQKKNTSEGKQQSEIEAYCKRKGHYLACDLIAEIKTGTTMARQGFWDALRLLVCLRCDPGSCPIKPELTYIELQRPCGCRSPQGADGVIAYDLDRVGRDARILLWLAFEFLATRRKELIILHGLDQVDTTTPEGRFHFIIMAGVAQYRRDRWVKDSAEARLIKAKQNKYACGRPPFGWTVHNHILIEVPQQQEALKIMEDLDAQGCNLVQIARELNTLGYQKKNGTLFRNSDVFFILRKNYRLREWVRSGCAYNHMEGSNGTSIEEANEYMVRKFDDPQEPEVHH